MYLFHLSLPFCIKNKCLSSYIDQDRRQRPVEQGGPGPARRRDQEGLRLGKIAPL